MPTFLDIGNSFSASAIAEDNLLLQLLHNNKRMVCSGLVLLSSKQPAADVASAQGLC